MKIGAMALGSSVNGIYETVEGLFACADSVPYADMVKADALDTSAAPAPYGGGVVAFALKGR